MKRIKLTESQIKTIQNEIKPKKLKLTESQFDRIFDTKESRRSFNEAMSKYKPQSLKDNKKTFKSFNEAEEGQKTPIAEFDCKYMNDEFAILKNGGKSYYFYYEDIDNDEFKEYGSPEILDTTIGDKGDPSEVFNTYDEVVIDEDLIGKYVSANYENMDKGFGVKGIDEGKEIVTIDKELANKILDDYPKEASEITSALISMQEATGSASSGSFTPPINFENKLKENIIKKINMFSEEEGVECKKMEDIEEATGSDSVGSFVTPNMWAKSKKDHIPSRKPMYKGGKIVESRESAKLFVAIKKAGFEPGVDFIMLNNNVWAKDMEMAEKIVNTMEGQYASAIDSKNINSDGNVSVSFGKPEGVQGELQLENSNEKKLIPNEDKEAYQELNKKIKTAIEVGGNVGKIKVGDIIYHFHLGNIKINDELISTTLHISGEDGIIKNKYNHGKDIHVGNLSTTGKSTLKQYELILKNIENGDITDLSDINDPKTIQVNENFNPKAGNPNGKFVKFDDCTKLNNNTEAQEGGCSQGAVDGVVITFESMCEKVAKECGKSKSKVKEILIKNKLHETSKTYEDFMYTELDKSLRESEEIKHYLEDNEINDDTCKHMEKEFGINKTNMNNIIGILGL